MKGKNERDCMFEFDQRAYDYFFLSYGFDGLQNKTK